jgi:outer membrane protein assembly factor BamB
MKERPCIMKGLKIAICVLCAIVLAQTMLTSQEWPRFRGPDGNSIVTDTNINPKALTEKPDILWKIFVGAGFSQVAVKDGRGYTLGNKNKKESVYCLDMKTGKTIWQYTYDCPLGEYAGSRSTPTIDGKCLYTLSEKGHLFCLDLATGKVVWQKNLETDFKAVAPRWDFASSCVVEGDMLLINTLTYGLALDKLTGKPIWQSPAAACGYSTPVLYTMGDVRGMLVFGSKAVYGVNVKTGAKLWSYPWSTSYDVNVADQLFVDNTVFISSNYGTGCALISIKNNKPVKVWANDVFNSHFHSFAYIDGFVYGNDGSPGNGTFKCMELSTGKEMWAENLGFGGLVATKDYLVMLTERGNLHIAKLSSKSYVELAKGKVLVGSSWTAPQLVGGKVICRNMAGDIALVNVSKK